MGQPNSIEEQVEAKLPKLGALSEFNGDQLWLTFYLMGPPENLERIADTLRGSGWESADGWEGEFLYLKVQAAKSVSSIVETARRVQKLCAEHEAEILNIDADTAPDINSRCVTLYHSPA